MSDSLRNEEGYIDLTAAEAIKNVAAEEEEVKREIKALMFVVRFIIDNSNFSLENRLVLRDKRTGRIYT